MVPIIIEIDGTDVMNKLEMLRLACTNAQFEQAIYRIYRRTGSKVREILVEDLPKDYFASPGRIAAAVKAPQIGGLSCTIPVVDQRGSIGGTYGASGGAHGWNSLKRKYKVKARIVKVGASTLPARMQGGQPPFRNLGSRLGGLTWTRTGKARGPIMKIMGIAIPQMPMNRSQGEVQGDIMEFLAQQVNSQFMALMGGKL